MAWLVIRILTYAFETTKHNPNHNTILLHLYLYSETFVYSPFMHHTLHVSLYVYMQVTSQNLC